jgi:hypothetical protein
MFFFASLDDAARRLHRGQAHHRPALNSIVGGPLRLYEGSRSLIQGAINELVKRKKERRSQK